MLGVAANVSTSENTCKALYFSLSDTHYNSSTKQNILRIIDPYYIFRSCQCFTFICFCTLVCLC